MQRNMNKPPKQSASFREHLCIRGYHRGRLAQAAYDVCVELYSYERGTWGPPEIQRVTPPTSFASKVWIAFSTFTFSSRIDSLSSLTGGSIARLLRIWK